MILFVNKYITQIKQLYIFDGTHVLFKNIDINYIHLHHLHLILKKKSVLFNIKKAITIFHLNRMTLCINN